MLLKAVLKRRRDEQRERELHRGRTDGRTDHTERFARLEISHVELSRNNSEN